ncbi:MAG: hypothetical protein QFX33_00535 [Candidatus Nezhaarchaeota archaeon]|nr:hypothetical protein [Candidatus Nezhaarchaeota archaeon]
MAKSLDCISSGLDTVSKNFVLFVPALAPIVVQLLFTALAYVFSITYFYPYHLISVPNPYIILLGAILAAIVGFIASCMLVDMTRDVLNGRPADIRKSFDYVKGRIGVLFIVAILAGLCSVTIILLPVAIFLVIAAVVEELNAVESLRVAFRFVADNIGEVVIFIVVVIVVGLVASYGLSLIPLVGSYVGAVVSWILNVIFTVSAVHLYHSLKAPPPPPPPPPPA